MEADLKIFDVVDSTNDTLKELADEGAPEGTCVLALSQRKGHGRSGRSFFSPGGGNVYMSLLLRPKADSQIDMITITAAVATVRAIKEVLGIDAGIKWVNDIICRQRKVCGIIALMHDTGKISRYVILGIGINVYESPDVPKDLTGKYGTILGIPCDLSHDQMLSFAERMARHIINGFSYFYEKDLYKEAVGIYREHCIMIGRDVEYMSGNSIRRAKVSGIDDGGGIVLETDEGSITCYDGEIRIIWDYMNLA